MGTVIEKFIREKGYKGSSSTLRHYISSLRKKFKSEKQVNTLNKITLNRSNILKLLYHPREKVKIITDEHYYMLCKRYPIFEKLHNLVWQFKDILKNHNIEDFEDWINRASELGIKELNSFIAGLERDKTGVINAVQYKYSNGLAEGTVNKIKVIKRIMYGRCGFDMLRTKTLRLEKLKAFN